MNLLRLAILSFMLSGVLQAAPDFLTDKAEYWRYESVFLSVPRSGSGMDPAKSPVLDAQVRHEGVVVAGPANRVRILLRYDKIREAWCGNWLPVFGARPGLYTAELLKPPAKPLPAPWYTGFKSVYALTLISPRNVLARADFQMKARMANALEPGFSVMSFEPGKPGYHQFPGPMGEHRQWRRIIDWASWMGADAIWHCAAESQTWSGVKAEDLPFSKEGLEMSSRLGQRAHAKGLSYGAYALAYIVLGPSFRKTQYTFTTAYDPSADALKTKRFISLADAQRQADLVSFFARIEADPNIDYAGLDYLRTDFGGLEFTDAFLAEVGLALNEELNSVEARQCWLGSIISRHEDDYVEALWQWWRAHKVAEVTQAILAQSGIRKPVWVFSLGWQQGHQHGQDPSMLVDAGIAFNAPMFYEATPPAYQSMLNSWRSYLQPNSATASLVLGEPVDAKLLYAQAGGASGPQLHIQRQMQAYEKLSPVAGSIGFFWHDLNRAYVGGRSAYAMQEWAMAGAASFAWLRQQQQAVPLRLTVSALSVNQTEATVALSFKNTSADGLKDITLLWDKMPGLEKMEPSYFKIKALPSGQELTMTAKATYLKALTPGKDVLLAWSLKQASMKHALRAVCFTMPFPATFTAQTEGQP
jgi:hypothetical protein